MVTFMIDKLLIKYASPTLGGIKTGSLFKVNKSNQIDLEKEIKYYNWLLNDLDLYLEIIYSCHKYDLIYIYKLRMLLEDFDNDETKDFLKSYGYECNHIDDYINNLKKRFNLLHKTPHEVGIFLGYPLNDVKSFIKYKGRNFKISGCWKVYGDVKSCSKKFQDFKQYKNKFTYLYENNHTLKSLIINNKRI